MATITTSTFLDGTGVNRTAGEVWNISNNATLTIRTDSRWHDRAPASMTGSLGAITLSSPIGGGVLIDARNVRWMAFDSGTGTVPAIGTTVTQGGVSGYLLGVWSSLTSAPTAVGASMPTTGWLKFREVTGGTYGAGALTGIGANATGPDTTGWIEVVFDNGVQMNNPNVFGGDGYISRGDWFYLDNTNGTPGQIIQAPTNGGGAQTRICAVQVETAPGSNVYEWWNGCFSTPWTTATAGVRPATDARSRLYQVLDNGQIRFGSDGTTNIGYTPPAGCKVRIPNIFLRVCLTASRASNAASYSSMTSTARFTGNGKFDFENVLADVGFATTGCFSFRMVNSCFGSRVDVSASISSVVLTSVCKGDNRANWGESAFNFSGNVGTIQADDISVFAYATGSAPWQMSASTKNITGSNWVYYEIPPSVGSISNMQFNGLNCNINGLKLRGKPLSVSGTNFNISNYDYIERLAGATTTTGSSFMLNLGSIYNSVFNGLSWGNNGQFADCHPRASSGVVFISGPSFGNVVRNLGTAESFLDTGATANTRPTSIINVAGGGSLSRPTKIQRVFCGAAQGLSINITDTTAENFVFEQVYTNTSTTGTWPIAQNFSLKAISWPNNQPSSGYAAPRGTNFIDFFNSNTTGRIAVFFPAPTPESESFLEYTFGANSGFDNGLILRNVNDFCIAETPEFIKGHTSFVNSALTFSGSNQSNHTYEYQINTGEGYGSWKTITGANLASETIDSDVGFKLRIRVTCTTANASNVVRSIFLNTNTTAAAQLKNLYPLDTVPVTLTNLVPGSEVRAYVGTDPATAVEIAGVESSGTSFTFNHSNAGQVGYIKVFALDYQPVVYNPYTYSINPAELLVQQVFDRNYANPA